ncbi:ankyrin repeat protein [Purpureocillium lavendulum]|uniref:Ankyrin repeat protein n=1 Tax=Purpureocillium lavendulum TaxID=1247861 RepID=A0AB34FRH2_9HYPO|nr:ankyrin repeat protein [Purpureocillium lavendulum]
MAMPADTYESLCNELYGDIFQKLECRENERERFVPWGTSKDIWQNNGSRNLRRFFHSLATSSQSSTEIFGVSEGTFVDRVTAGSLFDFLGTLIFATCSISAARAFVRHVVALNSQDGTVGQLPASRIQLQQLFDSVPDADRFNSKQGLFCAVVLRSKEEVRINTKTAECPRMPYLEQTPLGEGAFGKVFRVKVARGHFHDRHAGPAFGYNVEPMEMARKDYIVVDTAQAREEYGIMRQILGSTSRTCENIVESLGALEVDTNYSLFMPLAVCDLRSYMMAGHDISPTTQDARADIISCAAGLASGLQFLHTGIRTPDFDELVCYHMDLNPSNILVFQERSDDGGMRKIWKLSDFGMSRVKVRRRAASGDRENDFNSLFVRRKKAPDPSVSWTVNRRGEGTYLPPESISTTASMGTSSDVWALGCVISVVLTFLETGADGVRHYQDARIDHRRADGYDRFFIRGTRFTEPDVHPQIRIWHKALREKALKRNIAEGNAMSFMLDFLEQSVIRVNQRCTAENVKLKLEETYRLYRSAEESRRPSIFQTVTDSPLAVKLLSRQAAPQEQTKLRLVMRLDRADSSRQGSNADVCVDEWFPSTSGDFKGCAISPDANVLAYWTDTTIVLFTSQSLATRKGHTVAHTKEWQLPETDYDCFLKHLYIFNLHAGKYVDYNLTTFHRVVLQLPAISKIAISPDSAWVALTARASTNPRDPGHFMYAEGTIFQTDASVAMPANASDFKSIPLDWPAADVTHLSLPNGNDAYLVVRPELTTVSRDHKIPITHFSLDSHPVALDTLNIVSLGYDVSAYAGLFTAFCPFHDRNTCAVVTREKRFHIQKFEGSDASLELQREIPKYRISKLLPSALGPRGRLLAIGTAQVKQQMMLLEIHFSPTLNAQPLASLPRLSHGDDFDAIFSDRSPDPCVIVASLTGASRRVIYRVKLPPIDPTQAAASQHRRGSS